MTAYIRLFPCFSFPCPASSGLFWLGNHILAVYGRLQLAGTLQRCMFTTSWCISHGSFIDNTQQSLKFDSEVHGYEIILGTHLIFQIAV
jgi:hypothetical protein